MFAWLSEWYSIRRESKACESCDVLKQQLAIANQEREKLLDRILKEPVKEESVSIDGLKPVMPRHSQSWRVRQQALEAEDRKTAQILNQRENDAKRGMGISTDELEKELDIVGTERDSQKVS